MQLATPSFDDTLEDLVVETDPLPPEGRGPSRSASLESLYRTQAARLLRFFLRRTGREDAQDLVHETFARFAGSKGACASSVAKPEAYLSVVATNLLRDRARASARQALERHVPFDEVGIVSVDPHRLLEDRDRLARLEAAVARLSSRRRRIFLLHRLKRLTYAEIAEEVGMSAKGVKKQMAKALTELRRDMGPL